MSPKPGIERVVALYSPALGVNPIGVHLDFWYGSRFILSNDETNSPFSLRHISDQLDLVYRADSNHFAFRERGFP